jgi:MoaA/NifB/PqqE/SkfB family radical SAM enzyme
LKTRFASGSLAGVNLSLSSSDKVSGFHALLAEPLHWEIELSTRCNSRCLGCSRHADFTHTNPYYPEKTDLDKEVLLQVLRATPNLASLLFCGVYGDPLLHGEILPIFRMLKTEFPKTRVSVHSNASFGTGEFWTELGELFRQPGWRLKFALDGEAREHEAFRRGTSWTRTLSNAEIFIAAGGRADWHMIEFSTNEHQAEELRALAAQKGFHRFELRKNNYPGLENFFSQPNLPLTPAEKIDETQITDFELDRWNDEYTKNFVPGSIDCKSLAKKTLYLDASGKIWPCCWIGGLVSRPEHPQRLRFQRKTLKNIAPDFNSARSHSLENILSHRWFRENLPASWRTPERRNLTSTCAKTCGRCSPSIT